MRLTICITAALVLWGGSTAANAKPAAFQINGTTWTYVDHGVKARESVDAKGNYIENAVSGKHIDHGTAVMKGSKVCFTSAMNNDGESCWTTKATKVGQSMVTTNDKGKKLKVTRVKYVPMSMPK